MKKNLANLFFAAVLAAVNSMSVSTFAQISPTPSTGGGGSGSGSSGVPSSVSPVGTVDSEEVARLIASKGITEFRGEFTFSRVTGILGCDGRTNGFSTVTGQSCAGNTGSEEKVKGTFRLWNGRILDLVINGVEIPNDWNRYTLPVNAVGTVRGFHLAVEGVNDRERVLYGDFRTYELSPGETIQIVLRPNAVPFFLAYTPEVGADTSNLRFEVQNGTEGYNTYYDEQHGGFGVWITPGMATSYRIYDEQNNRIIETGSVDTTRLVVIPSEEPTLFASIIGNVEHSLDGWFSKRGLQMDSTIVQSDGTATSGKVVAYNNRGTSEALEVQVQGLMPGSKILVKKINEELSVVSEFIVPEGEEWKYSTFTTSGVVDNAVVTILGKAWDEEGFFLSLRPYSGVGTSPTTLAP